MAEDLKKVYIRTFEEVYRLVDSRLRSIRQTGVKARSREVALRRLLATKLTTACDIIRGELERVGEALRLIEGLGDFYREVFRLYTGIDTGEAYSRIRKSLINLARIESSYLSELEKAAEREAVTSLFREGLGRCLSVYKRNNKIISRVKTGVAELSKMPSVRGDMVVVIAGMPQVGKSTLLSRLTRARPEIGTFPFTTKTIIVGHLGLDEGVIVLVDTPGILDRPVSEMNEIELKAVLAVKHLSNAVLYVFDANPNAYYSLSQQIAVYESVKSMLGGKPIIVALNKIDTLGEGGLGRLLEEIGSKIGVRPIPVSALTGAGLEELKKALADLFRAGRRLL
ncbi:NOG1 family protein [Thermogladius sp. 4427co]|uniref:NOG1 family protein n=1 Tax=Thermogladius sp. 4427co TaxID=3450718 RepID=UPI003F7A3CC9